MLPHHRHFRLGELPGLVEDQVRYAQLPDVVQQRGPPQEGPLLARQADPFDQRAGDDRGAAARCGGRRRWSSGCEVKRGSNLEISRYLGEMSA